MSEKEKYREERDRVRLKDLAGWRSFKLAWKAKMITFLWLLFLSNYTCMRSEM